MIFAAGQRGKTHVRLLDAQRDAREPQAQGNRLGLELCFTGKNLLLVGEEDHMDWSFADPGVELHAGSCGRGVPVALALAVVWECPQ